MNKANSEHNANGTVSSVGRILRVSKEGRSKTKRWRAIVRERLAICEKCCIDFYLLHHHFVQLHLIAIEHTKNATRKIEKNHTHTRTEQHNGTISHERGEESERERKRERCVFCSVL